MVFFRSDLSSVVEQEMYKFKDIFDYCLEQSRPFDYLEVVARQYNFSKYIVFDEALDSFNYYVSRGARKDYALIWSLERTHEVVLKQYLTQKN